MPFLRINFCTVLFNVCHIINTFTRLFGKFMYRGKNVGKKEECLGEFFEQFVPGPSYRVEKARGISMGSRLY